MKPDIRTLDSQAVQRDRGLQNSNQRFTWRQRVRSGREVCIYCGAASVSVEHMPPRTLFLGKDRPSGMEFASCAACNEGTGWIDQLASFVARIQIVEGDSREDKEFLEALQAVKNNHPGLLQSMRKHRGSEKLALAALGLPSDYGAVTVTPILHAAMLGFTAKLGFAVHQEIRKTRVPDEGGVLAVWLSNAQTLRGGSFEDLGRFLGETRVLAQGKKTSAGQFWYKVGEMVEGHLVCRASLRRSGVDLLSIAGQGQRFIEWASGKFDGSHLFRPGDLRQRNLLLDRGK